MSNEALPRSCSDPGSPGGPLVAAGGSSARADKQQSSLVQPIDDGSKGYENWKQRRAQWITPSPTGYKKQTRPSRSNAMYLELLLEDGMPLPQPAPLKDVVEFLVEVWEEDGMEGF